MIAWSSQNKAWLMVSTPQMLAVIVVITTTAITDYIHFALLGSFFKNRIQFIYLFIYLFIYFYLFIFGCAGSWLLHAGFLQLRERGLLFIAMHRLLIVVASLVVEHGVQSAGVSVVVAHGLSSCGTWAQSLHGIWNLPGPEIEPVYPALAGGFLTIAPPRKSHYLVLNLL